MASGEPLEGAGGLGIEAGMDPGVPFIVSDGTFAPQTSANIDPIQLMNHIVQSYVTDVTAFHERERGRFVFRPLAKKIFDPYEPAQVRKIYVDLLKVAAAADANGIRYGAQAFPASLVTQSELLLNLIVSYQLIMLPKPSPSEESQQPTQANNSSSLDLKKKKQAKKQPPQARVILWNHDAAALFSCFLKISLVPEHRIWKQIRFILNPTNNRERFDRMAPYLVEAVQGGTICFTPLMFFMTDPVFAKHLDKPAILQQALYLGKLKASTVESFVMHRSHEFRKECRKILQQAELAAADIKKFEADHPANIPLDHVERRQMTYRVFRQNIVELMMNLKGVETNDQLINLSWAAAAFKKYSAKTYVEKTWKEEQLYDLIWTIMSQRGKLKRFICEHLEKQCHDYGAAHFWSKMYPANMDKKYIPLPKSTNRIDPLANIENTLNFPPEVQAIHMVQIEQQLHGLTEVLKEQIRMNGQVAVGIDTEWSAYLAINRASILQLAVRGAVYIIDTDAKDFEAPNEGRLSWFLDWFFANEKIIKIGFQFSEDLLHLRTVIPQCSALYAPNSLFCIGKIIVNLLEKTEKRHDGSAIKEALFPNLDNGTLAEVNREESIAPPELDDDEYGNVPASENSIVVMADDSLQSVAGSQEVHEQGTSGEETVEKEEVEGSEKRKSKVEDEEKVRSLDAFTDNAKSDDDAMWKKSRKPIESASQRTTQKGLSSLCFQLLGFPLDKTEQCSVWNRRPLRPLQIRYAAMDAYCVLMLYDRCIEWAGRLNISIEAILADQHPIRASLPLLMEFP